jgi:hypothetical protein
LVFFLLPHRQGWLRPMALTVDLLLRVERILPLSRLRGADAPGTPLCSLEAREFLTAFPLTAVETDFSWSSEGAKVADIWLNIVRHGTPLG